MQKVQSTYGAGPRVSRGNYTEGALARSPFQDLRIKVGDATQNVLACERQHEDLERPVTFAIAHRDVVGAGLTDTAALLRLGIVSRSRHATRERPYTDLFENGLAEYSTAKLDDKAVVFGLLVSRIQVHLAPDDPLRLQYLPILLQQLADWADARSAIVAAREERDAARQIRDNACDTWDGVMVEVYGLLVARVGKEVADRYFVKTKSRPSRITTAPATPTVDPTPVSSSFGTMSDPIEAK